ncbi:MAG: YIP1 family protein [Desulfobaccales bacterium]
MTTLEEDWGTVPALPEPARQGVPWEDPELSGWVGFFRTLRDLLLHPGEFFDNLGPGGRAEPLAFALIVSTAGVLIALFWHFLILAGALGNAPGPVSSLNLGTGALLGLMIVSPLLVLAHLAVGSLCWWGSMALSGAGRDFTPAWRIFCYAHGGLVLALIPFLGMPLAGVWILILMYIGAKEVFGLSAFGALGALATFLIFQAMLGMVLLLGLTIGLAGLGFMALLG